MQKDVGGKVTGGSAHLGKLCNSPSFCFSQRSDEVGQLLQLAEVILTLRVCLNNQDYDGAREAIESTSKLKAGDACVLLSRLQQTEDILKDICFEN